MPQLLPYYLINTLTVLAMVLVILILISTSTIISLTVSLIARKALAV